jgi:hypothetical protein
MRQPKDTEQSPRGEPDSRLISHNISRMLWKKNCHHRDQNSYMRRMCPVNTLMSYFRKIHFNIIFPATPSFE